MKAVLLLDRDDHVAAWQYEALKIAIDKGLDIVQVAHCVDARRPPRQRKYAAYSALALASRWRMASIKPMSVRPLLNPDVPEVSFWSEWEAAWQRIPAAIAEGFRGADVIIKFGMNLLRGPDTLPVTCGVLSYHHGDPELARGQPAGYYELVRGLDVQGVVVQRLSDTLDGGEILASAYARVVPHSYSQTLKGAFRVGIPLLAKAVEAAEDGRGRQPLALGPNYQLPTNGSVARAAATMVGRKVGRLAYGLLVEKRWQVGRLTTPVVPETESTVGSEDVEAIDTPAGYTFTADPCPSPRGGVYCEALNRASGKGEIARWRSGEWTFLDLGLGGGHASYPQVVEADGSVFLFPEIAEVSRPTLFRLAPDGVVVEERIELEGLDGLRILDGTLFHRNGTWYLFGGTRQSVSSQLDLWMAPSLVGPFRLHPSSPVCLDPRGARMAGPIAEIGGRLYRFGQDGTRNYGGRVTVHRIDVIGLDRYEEQRCGSVQCSGSWGPHTIAVGGDTIWIDFFTETRTPLAGVRRLTAKSARLGRHVAAVRSRAAPTA